MLGVQDFIGTYDWTFEYLRRTYGEDTLREYWGKCIAFDSQQHAVKLITEKGFAGMEEYWGHTLAMEEAGYVATRSEGCYRIDMHRCPSKGFLLEHGLGAYADYCEHCMGWIKPVMDRAGFVLDHVHNHQGQCWWEIRRAGADRVPSPPVAEADDVTKSPAWRRGVHHRFRDSRRVEEEG